MSYKPCIDLSIVHVNLLISCSKWHGSSNICRNLVLSRFATFCRGKNHEPPRRRRRRRRHRWTKTKGEKGGKTVECSPRQSLLQRYDIAAKRNHCSRSSSVSLPILSVLAQGWPNRSMNTAIDAYLPKFFTLNCLINNNILMINN